MEDIRRNVYRLKIRRKNKNPPLSQKPQKRRCHLERYPPPRRDHVHVHEHLVNRGAPEFNFGSVNHMFRHRDEMEEYPAMKSSGLISMMENLKGLLELLQLTKLKYVSVDFDPKKLRVFWKDFVDTFDISLFSVQINDRFQDFGSFLESASESSPSSAAATAAERKLDTSSFASNDVTPEKPSKTSHVVPPAKVEIQTEALSEMAVDAVEEKLLEAAVHVLAQQYHPETDRIPLEKSYSGLSYTKPSAFARRAYGVSKTDRMRAEAELEEEGLRFARLWEDDETVVSTDTRYRNSYVDASDATLLTVEQWDDNEDVHLGQLSASSSFYDDAASEYHHPSPRQSKPSPGGETVYSIASERAKSIRDRLSNIPSFGTDSNIAKRVNSVAQVMMAPCMAPSLATVR